MKNNQTKRPGARKSTPIVQSWPLAVDLVEKYLREPAKADDLLERALQNVEGDEARRTRFLFLGVMRWLGLLEHVIDRLVPKSPRPNLRAALLVAGYELTEANEEDRPKVVDYAVGQTKRLMSKGEAGLVNAVLRKWPTTWQEVLDRAGDDAAGLALRYAHPEWLVKRWSRLRGSEEVEALLEWDQGVSATYLRLVEQPEGGWVDALEETPFPGYWRLKPGAFGMVVGLLNDGKAYIQDPLGRHPVELLAPQSGERIIDLCAAPGGKTTDIAGRMAGGGVLAALDRPSYRFRRLQENLSRVTGPDLFLLETDLLNVTPSQLRKRDLPGGFDGVLIDVPCSNTGVLRRRPDAKWRLAEGDIAEMAELQLRLLNRAGALVKPGGRLVYSTCSLEREENRDVVEAFLDGDVGRHFTLGEERHSFPPEAGHDGGYAVRLERL